MCYVLTCFLMFLADIDECSTLVGVCRNGRCINTIGGFSCDCIPGYTPTPDKTRCRGKEHVNHVRLDLVSRVNARVKNGSLALRRFGSSHTKINVKRLCIFYVFKMLLCVLKARLTRSPDRQSKTFFDNWHDVFFEPMKKGNIRACNISALISPPTGLTWVLIGFPWTFV